MTFLFQQSFPDVTLLGYTVLSYRALVMAVAVNLHTITRL